MLRAGHHITAASTADTDDCEAAFHIRQEHPDAESLQATQSSLKLA